MVHYFQFGIIAYSVVIQVGSDGNQRVFSEILTILDHIKIETVLIQNRKSSIWVSFCSLLSVIVFLTFLNSVQTLIQFSSFHPSCVIHGIFLQIRLDNCTIEVVERLFFRLRFLLLKIQNSFSYPVISIFFDFAIHNYFSLIP